MSVSVRLPPVCSVWPPSSRPHLNTLYPQVGGLRYAFNASNPIGQRILSVSTSEGAPIDPCKMYNVVTNNYMSAGGDGYAMMAAARTLEANGPALDQVAIDRVIARTPVRGDRQEWGGEGGRGWTLQANGITTA